MSKDKLPHELSLDELLRSIEGQDLKKEEMKFSSDNPILSFIQAFKISAGDNKVSSGLLHNLYKVWNKDTYVNRISFTKRLSNYIPSYTKGVKYFLVNNKVLELAKSLELLQKKKSTNRSYSLFLHKQFEQFLSDTGLAAGNIYVESDILYYIYTRWCDGTRKRRRVPYPTFLGICKMNFECKRLCDNKNNWYAVNTKIYKLIKREEVERWRNGKKKKTGNKETKKGVKEKIVYPKKV